MRLGKVLSLLTPMVVFAACGGGGDGGGGGGGNGGGGGSGMLDAQSASALAGFFGDFYNYEGAGLKALNPAGLVQQYTDPNPYGKTPLQGCTPAWQGDTTDNDVDGIFVNASLQMDCDTTLPNYNLRVQIRGIVTSRDNADNDPWVGRVEFAGLNQGEPFVYSLQYNTSTYTVELQGYLDVSRSSDGNTYVVQANWMFSDPYDGYTFEASGTMGFTPSDPSSWTPGNELDGTLTLDYTLTWSSRNLSSSLTGLTVTTPTPITLSASCWGGGPVGGTIRVTDGANNVLEVTWTDCDQYSATFNGNPISPAS